MAESIEGFETEGPAIPVSLSSPAEIEHEVKKQYEAMDI